MDREIHKEMKTSTENLIKEHERSIKWLTKFKESLQAQLEAEKPKLRHGDYGITKEGHPRIALWQWTHSDTQGGRRRDYSQLGIMGEEKEFEVFGNIFDDLADMAEDLEEFELDYIDGEDCMPHTEAKITSDGKIEFRFLSATSKYELTQFKRLHRLSGRLLATAIRKAE